MYLNTGDISLIKNTSTYKKNYMIFAELVDTTMSFEKPVLIHTVEELNLWFGKFFSSYFYLKNLLLSSDDTALLLYKPSEILYAIPEEGKNTISLKEDKKFLTKSDLPKIGKISTFYYVDSEDTYYIYENNTWMNEHEYINQSYYDISGNNRDVLVITSKSNKFFDYYYPLYNSASESFMYKKLIVSTKNIDKIIGNLRDIDLDKINNGEQTLAFNIEVNSRAALNDDGFIIIPVTKGNDSNNLIGDYGKFNLFYTSDSGKEKALSLIKELDITDLVTISENKLIAREDLINAFYTSGYFITNVSSYSSTSFSFCAYSVIPVKSFNIVKYDNVSITERPDFSNDVLANLSKDTNSIFFYSKIIGASLDKSEKNEISVKIEAINLNKKLYRFAIKKQDYEEIYEGPLIGSNEYERIDYVISNNSKLVYCKLIDTTLDLKEGTYTLKGAIPITTNYNFDYYMGLNMLLSYANEKEIYPDYVLVPDIRKYVLKPSDFSTFSEVANNFAKYFNTQFLITNKFCSEDYQDVTEESTPYDGCYSDTLNTGVTTIYKMDDCGTTTDTGVKSYLYVTFPNFITSVLIEDEDRIKYARAGNDYIFNKIDPDNRLLYFYQNCYVDNVFEVPLYYLYIQGILNDVYSYTSDAITLENTVNEDPYNENELEKNLQKYKSNYMVCNNHIYYFKKMQDGETYNTTGFMRFILGKIYRELQKNRGALVGEKFKDKIEAVIRNILSEIEERYSIIKYLNINQINYNDISNSLTLSINVGVKEVVGDDVTIDYVLNYNND
jgi:hypothetical protein